VKNNGPSCCSPVVLSKSTNSTLKDTGALQEGWVSLD